VNGVGSTKRAIFRGGLRLSGGTSSDGTALAATSKDVDDESNGGVAECKSMLLVCDGAKADEVHETASQTAMDLIFILWL